MVLSSELEGSGEVTYVQCTAQILAHGVPYSHAPQTDVWVESWWHVQWGSHQTDCDGAEKFLSPPDLEAVCCRSSVHPRLCVVMLRYINPPHCPLDKSSWSLNNVGVRGVDPHLPMQLKICLKLSPNFSVPRGLVPGPPLVPKCQKFECQLYSTYSYAQYIKLEK